MTIQEALVISGMAEQVIPVTKKQVERKKKVGVSGHLIIELGLAQLEQDTAMAEEYEKKLNWQKENNR